LRQEIGIKIFNAKLVSQATPHSVNMKQRKLIETHNFINQQE